jgi:hypothetical protein
MCVWAQPSGVTTIVIISLVVRPRRVWSDCANGIDHFGFVRMSPFLLAGAFKIIGPVTSSVPSDRWYCRLPHLIWCRTWHGCGIGALTFRAKAARRLLACLPKIVGASNRTTWKHKRMAEDHKT